MIDFKTFYNTFQINYFDYRQLYLKHLIENSESLHIGKEVFEYSKDDYIRTLKIDVRQTLFLAIETFFEVFFALTVDKNGIIDDFKILEKITKSRNLYEKIEKIGLSIDELSFLDDIVTLKDKSKVSTGKYIFYFGLDYKNNKHYIDPSLPEIKKGIRVFATEFLKHGEYNCYKHGLRIFPTLKEFKILNSKTKKEIIVSDISDSITYFYMDSKSKKIAYPTHIFDYKRDIQMTHAVSNLLWNIIKLRSVAFSKNKNDKELDVIYFNKGYFNTVQKQNVQLQDLTFTIQPNEIRP